MLNNPVNLIAPVLLFQLSNTMETTEESMCVQGKLMLENKTVNKILIYVTPVSAHVRPTPWKLDIQTKSTLKKKNHRKVKLGTQGKQKVL